MALKLSTGAPAVPRALLIAALSMGLMAADAAAQSTGRVVGRVHDAETTAPLSSVQISIQSTGSGTLTGNNGEFVLSQVPLGEQSFVIQSLGYASETITGVQVASGEAVNLEIALTPQAVKLEGITISATRDMGSNSALLSERSRSGAVMDAIGADQIARSGDGDAASALKRAPGVSVVDGKFVYVRGLGERYGATTLNGAPLPSPIPDKTAVPLDLIPTGLLESVVTAKTYTPDQPGDFTGGLVQLETKHYPTARVLKLSTSVGYNTTTSLTDGLGYPGGRYDWLGFDDGSRDIPFSASEEAHLPAEPAERQLFLDAVTDSWMPTGVSVPLNQSYGITYGDEIDLNGSPLGFIATGSYSNSYETTDLTKRYYAAGMGPSLQVDYDGQSTTTEIALGGLFGAGLQLGDANRISATAIFNRLVADEARALGGLYESQGPFIQAPTLKYVANELISTQLKGEHMLTAPGGLNLEWRAGYARAERYEPNTRTVLYTAEKEDGPYSFYASPSSGLVFHQNLADNSVNGAIDLEIPFDLGGTPAALTIGASGEMRNRDVYTRRFRLVPNNGGLSFAVQSLRPDELFVPERIGTEPDQFGVVESTFREDNYQAEQTVYAGYAMFDAVILPRLRAVVGARIESAAQTVTPTDLFGPYVEPLDQASLENVDILPALNLTYGLTEEMNLRAGLSRTVARPQVRELTPFLFADYYGGLTTRGNPFLQQSRISNGDLRWEWFFRPGAVLSVSAFGKKLDRPIEPFALVLGSAPGQTWVNTDRATLYGTELEFRSDLGFLLGDAFDAVSLNANVTLASSSVDGDTVVIYGPDGGRPLQVASSSDQNRPLFGQSPYVVNLGVSYEHPGAGTRATVLFNRFGQRLEAFGGAALPDIYEKGRTQLDLVLAQPLWDGTNLEISASNLLGSEVRFIQTFPNGEVVTTSQHDEGRRFSLSLSWEPGSR